MVAALALLIGTLWSFPTFWYTASAAKGQFKWLAEQTQVEGWQYEDFGIAEAAEAILVGDRMVNGQFSTPDRRRSVQVFSAKRYEEKENEIGLFSHTPDRCWTIAGWQIEPAEPQTVECTVHGVSMRLERRVFIAGPQRHLVYFGALVGGEPLPYRLDQYLAANLKKTQATQSDEASTWLRLRETRLWGWAWDSFVNRTALAGPQQFLRISTPVVSGDFGSADKLLQEFLPLWLVPTDYEREAAEWRAAPKPPKQAAPGGDPAS